MTYRPVLTAASLAALAFVAACGSASTSNQPLYDGVPFKAKAKPVDKKTSLAVFQIEIKGADRSPLGARQAADHEGTRYCVTNYGSSDIAWANDPADGDTPLAMTDGRVVFQGTCTP